MASCSPVIIIGGPVSKAERKFDRAIQAKQEALQHDLAVAAEELRKAGNISFPHRTSTDEVLTGLQQALQECAAVVRDHGMGTIKASDETLIQVSRTLDQVSAVLGSLNDYLDVIRGIPQP